MTDNPTPGYSIQKVDYAKRLNRIEGQVRRHPDDRRAHLLHRRPHPDHRRHQALQAVTIGLLDEHVRHCIRNAMAVGDDDTIETILPRPPRPLNASSRLRLGPPAYRADLPAGLDR